VLIYEHALHHALNVVAGFREWDAFDPVDRVYLWRTRIAIRFDPLGDVAAAGVVGGEHQDREALPILDQFTEVGSAELRVVRRFQ
jgi:hypothetical protein